jgi:hypothetical protein
MTLALALAASAQIGCAGTGSESPRSAFPGVAAVAGPRAACSINGAVRVIDDRVAPSAVDAMVAESRVWLRYDPRVHRSLVVGLDPESLQIVTTMSSPATGGDGAVVPASWLEPVGARAEASSGRAIARVDAARSLVAWSEGTVERGYQVRLVTLSAQGEPLGGVVAIDREGSAISSPVVSIGPAGRGVVAFLESNGRGFQLVAAPLECGGEHPMLAQSSP